MRFFIYTWLLFLDRQHISVTANVIPSPSALPAFKATPILLPPPIPKFLPITPSPPDVLGISQVSGFYGPGTWASWIVTGATSWYRLAVDNRAAIDPNTWVFLLVINWASVDLIRHVHSLQVLRGARDVSSDKHLGSIGAAFTIVFWGAMHELLQIYAVSVLCHTLSRPQKARKRRAFTLAAGLILPLVAMSHMLFTLGYFVDNAVPSAVWSNIPALYGPLQKEGLNAKAFKLHGDYLMHACLIGPWVLFIGTCISFYLLWRETPERTKANFLDTLKPCMKLIIILYNLLAVWSCLSMVVAFIVLFYNEDKVWIVFASSPFLVIEYFLMYQVMFLFLVPLNIIMHIFLGVHSQSCFFMPCAPQSIKEWDQAFSLFVAVSLLIGTEIAPNITRRWKCRREERRAFETEIRQRIEMEMGQQRATTD